MNNNAALLERLSRGDQKAFDELVCNNLNLVRSITKRYADFGYDMDDLNQIGVIGLIKAIHKFDISYEVKFSTYAVPVVMGEIKRFLRDDGMIKISRRLKENALRGRKCAQELSIKLGREASVEEIAKEMGIKSEDLIEAFDATLPTETITPLDKEGGERELFVADDKNTEEKMVNHILITDSLEKLSNKEKQVIILRYFQGKTQSETAEKVGVSQVQVSRIEKKAIQNLRKQING